jgi:hypothetical protein
MTDFTGETIKLHKIYGEKHEYGALARTVDHAEAILVTNDLSKGRQRDDERTPVGFSVETTPHLADKGEETFNE